MQPVGILQLLSILGLNPSLSEAKILDMSDSLSHFILTPSYRGTSPGAGLIQTLCAAASG